MSWSGLKNKISNLIDACDNNKSIIQPWSEISAYINNHQTPYHLYSFVKITQDYRQDKLRDEIWILDHGCGGGTTLLYLLALGYKNVYGVDVRNKAIRWNRIFKEIFNIDEERFICYDGQNLPFESNTFDIIFSEQVLEHVDDSSIVNYYSEEGRTLKNNGIVYHEVPHRLVPYDSHTRTWFIHYLPYRVYIWLHKKIGTSNVDWIPYNLFLRWPKFHKKKLRQYIGEYTDVTAERLLRLQKIKYYDGPKNLRLIISKLVKIPLIGNIFILLIKNFVMLGTVTTKK